MARRLFFIDFVKTVAAISVITLHISALYLYQWQVFPTQWWITALIINTLARPAVPLFFLVGGYLLLNKQNKILPFYFRRFLRIIPPWVFWGGISWLIIGGSLSSIKATFLHGFWFMPVILGIYVFAPLYQKVTTKISYKQFLLILFLWVLWMMSVLAAKHASYITHAHSFWFMIFGYSGYFLAGGFMQLNQHFFHKKYIQLVAILFVTSLIFTVGITYIESVRTQQFWGLWTFELSPNILLLSTTSFWLLRHYATQLQKSQKGKSFIQKTSKATLGIFLSHVVILQFAQKIVLWFDLPTPAIHPLLFIPIGVITVFLLAWRISVLVKKIPLLGWGSGVA